MRHIRKLLRTLFFGKAREKIVAGFSLITPGLAFSQSYSWYAYGAPAPLPPIYFSTAQEACASLKFDRWLPLLVYKNTHMTPNTSREGDFRCWQIETNTFTGATSTENMANATRVGDGCPLGTIYRSDGRCEKIHSYDGGQKGPSSFCPSAYAGNPINFAIGNKFQSETDYQAPGGSSLVFSRAYNSLDGLWRHGFSTHLRLSEPGLVTLVMHHGREITYSLNGAAITTDSTELGMLSKTAEGWNYLTKDNERFDFTEAGQLKSWSNTLGASYSLSYSNDRITVTDQFGNHLTYTEDQSHQPLSLEAPGKVITYRYDQDGHMVSLDYRVEGQARQRLFHYEDPRDTRLLTGITDERGVRYATWRYDEKGRAISSEHAGGAEHISVAYSDDGTVYVTNEAGRKTLYRFKIIQGIKRITAIEGKATPNCTDTNSSYTYDERGLLKSKIDSRHNTTTYLYDERGLEISRTEAAGKAQARTIMTKWHPTLFLPQEITESTRSISYHYDEHGRLLKRTVTSR